MLQIVSAVTALWLFCLVLGWATLAPVDKVWRDRLFPAAPAFGAAFACVLLHLTGLVVGVGIGVWLALGVCAVLVVASAAAGRAPLQVSRNGWLGLAWGAALAVPGATVALWPNLRAGTGRVLFASSNLDSIFYAGEDSWLRDHSLLTMPAPASIPGQGNTVPIEAPAVTAFTFPLRVGQTLVSAAAQQLTNNDQVTAFLPSLAVWIIIGAGATFVALQLLGLGPTAASVGALLCSVATLTTRSAFDQHADSLLGMSLVGLTIATFLVALRDGPRWPAAVMLTGLVGIYTEYGTYIGPALAVACLALPGPDHAARARRGLEVIALAVCVSPLVWIRGVQGMLAMLGNDGGDEFPSPFLTSDLGLSVAHALGLATIYDTDYSRPLVVVVTAFVVLGIVAALARSPHRVPLGLMLAFAAAGITMASVQERGYLQDRVVTLTVPLAIITATIGWSHLVEHVAKRRTTAWRSLAAIALAGSAALASTNAVVGLDASNGLGRPRVIGENYDKPAEWVTRYGGPDGEDLTVAVADLVSQSWIQYILRDSRQVSYLSIIPSYAAPQEYWDEQVDRYLVVGQGAVYDAPPEAILDRAGPWVLLDMTKGAVAVAVPAETTKWSIHVRGGHHSAAASGALVRVLRSPSASDRISIELAAAARELETGAVIADAQRQVVEVGRQPAAVPVPFAHGAQVSTLQLQVDTPQPPSMGWRLRGVRLDQGVSSSAG